MGHIAHLRKQIKSKNSYDYHNADYEKKKSIFFFMRSEWFFIWTNLNPIHPRSLVEIGPVVLEKKIFKNASMYFCYFIIISPWKMTQPLIWTNFGPLHPRMLCAKFGWNWSSVSWEEHEKVKSLRQWRRTMDIFETDKLTWTFGSGELKIIQCGCLTLTVLHIKVFHHQRKLYCICSVSLVY